MKDIPLFTTENGAGCLILKQIPYTKKAYVSVGSAQSTEAFLQECVDFCRAVGAEAVYATGIASQDVFPLHTVIVEMQCELSALPDTDARLVPVDDKTLSQWREIYNRRMSDISNSVHMTTYDIQQYCRKGEAYFVYRNDLLLGIGIVGGDTVSSVISVVSGSGRDVLLALTGAISADTVKLEVSSDNPPAIALYERLGFTKTREISRWYKIF